MLPNATVTVATCYGAQWRILRGGGSSRLQSPFGRRTDDVTVLLISDNLKTCSKTRTWKHAVDVGGVGLATLLWLWPEHGTTTFRQRSRPRRRCWSSANNSKTFLFQSAFHWLNDGSRWTELQRSRVLTVTEISACWMIKIVTGTSAAAGFWLGRVNCRLRWRKFWKLDYEMVHSEVYLNKYVVSTAPFSTPACLDCSQNIT